METLLKIVLKNPGIQQGVIKQEFICELKGILLLFWETSETGRPPIMLRAQFGLTWWHLLVVRCVLRSCIDLEYSLKLICVLKTKRTR